MSTEQSEGETQTAPDITQQATTPTATTSIQRAKNPKRVAAGKLVAERTRLAREQQKKVAAEASIMIANNKAKATAPDESPEPSPEGRGLSTTQWLMVASIVVGLAGIYYKREELKAALVKKTPEPAPEPTRVDPEPAPAKLRKMN